MLTDTTTLEQARARAIQRMTGTEGEAALRRAVFALELAEKALLDLVDDHPDGCDCRWCRARADFESAQTVPYVGDRLEPLDLAEHALEEVAGWRSSLSGFLVVG